MRYKIIRKRFGKMLLTAVFSSFVATLAAGQTNLQNYVQHVIVIIQENRTPDTLFNQDSVLAENGAHVQPSFPR